MEVVKVRRPARAVEDEYERRLEEYEQLGQLIDAAEKDEDDEESDEDEEEE
jgi:hypothetical protein